MPSRAKRRTPPAARSVRHLPRFHNTPKACLVFPSVSAALFTGEQGSPGRSTLHAFLPSPRNVGGYAPVIGNFLGGGGGRRVFGDLATGGRQLGCS